MKTIYNNWNLFILLLKRFKLFYIFILGFYLFIFRILYYFLFDSRIIQEGKLQYLFTPHLIYIQICFYLYIFGKITNLDIKLILMSQFKFRKNIMNFLIFISFIFSLSYSLIMIVSSYLVNFLAKGFNFSINDFYHIILYFLLFFTISNLYLLLYLLTKNKILPIIILSGIGVWDFHTNSIIMKSFNQNKFFGITVLVVLSFNFLIYCINEVLVDRKDFNENW